MSFDLSLGAVDGISQTIDNTGGSGVTLPSATTTDAGLMSADDKANIILQGGNAFGVPVQTGSTDTSNYYLNVNSVTKVALRSTNVGFTVPLINNSSVDNASLNLSATGTRISRNIADPNPALDVNLANILSTAAIQRWQQGGSLRAFVNSAGSGTFGRLFAGPALTQPNYLLDVNAGTVAGANTLANFSQNNGSVTINNSTSAAGVFNPLIKGNTGNTQSGLGIMIIGAGSPGYSTGAILLRAENGSSGAIASGNVLAVQNSTTNLFKVDYTGVVNVTNLAGTGTRIVTADSAGNLSSVASVPIANGGTGLTNAGTNGQILVSDGTNFVLTTPTPQFIKNNYPFPYLIPDSSVTENSGINTNGGFGTGPIVYQFAAMAGYVVTEVDYMVVFIGDSLVYLPNPEDWVGRILELKLNPSAGNPSATCYLTGGNPSITYPVYDGLVQINSFEAKQGARIKIQAAYSDAVSLFCWEVMDMNVW